MAVTRILNKQKDIIIDQEGVMMRTKLALQTGDIAGLYETYRVPIPTKCKVAMFLVHQFETSDFDFMEIVEKEQILQSRFEAAQNIEIWRSCLAGAELVEQNRKMKEESMLARGELKPGYELFQ